MIAATAYLTLIQDTLSKVWASQGPVLEQASEWMASALMAERFVYVFGSGHSHLLAEEVFYRAGGLAQAVPIFDESLMLHESASESTTREREAGAADRILLRYPITAGDVLVIVSNSGRNAVPIEMAESARARGVKTIALTSLQHSRSVTSRHGSGRRLFEVADLVIDNGSVVGDAGLEVTGIPQRMGPTSTIVGAFLINALMIEAAARAALMGRLPDVYESANASDGAHNAALLAKYRERVRHL